MPSDGSRKSSWWQWPNLLGLDAPIIAVIWEMLFSRGIGANIPPVFHLILALGVWCIYLADRIADTLKFPTARSETARHRFTRSHLTALAVLTLVAGSIEAFLIFTHLPWILIRLGLFNAGLLAFYYISRFSENARLRAFLPREIFCGFIFALGTLVIPIAFSAPPFHLLALIPPALAFALLCAANCVLISLWEHSSDTLATNSSLATRNSRLIPHLPAAVILLAIASLLLAFTGQWQIFLPIAISAAALFALTRFEENFTPSSLRILADAVLLTPIPFLFF